MTATRQSLTIEEGILNYELTKADIALVEDLILAAGAETAYLIPSDGYVGFLNREGAAVAYLYRSYMTITPRADVMPEGDRPTTNNIEPGGVDVFLSAWDKPKVHRGSGRGVAKPVVQTVVRPGAVCSSCNMEIPRALSVCPDC